MTLEFERATLTAAVVLLVSALACTSGAADGTPAPATQEEANMTNRGDWITLFDGTNLDAWRGFRREDLPAAWRVQDGQLHFDPTATQGGAEAGDVITREQFGDFELELEWRVADAGNSGIFFRVTEEVDRTFESGPEMQVLDNAGHADGNNPLTSAGANYGLHAPSRDMARPVGEWNLARIRVEGPMVEHWLNGEKVVEYELWSDDWNALVQGSKFVEWPGYGMAREGHIALQDHGDPVWYRTIRVRGL